MLACATLVAAISFTPPYVPPAVVGNKRWHLRCGQSAIRMCDDGFVDPFEYILGDDVPPATSPAPSSAVSPVESTAAEDLGLQQILFIECGFGNDQHGQDATKAAVRACRNAIEFNSIPSIRSLVPGGYDGMKLHVQLGVPVAADEVDLKQVAAVFPYGTLLPIRVEHGGLLAKSGIALAQMGDANDSMIIAVACVTVGY